MRVPFDAWEKKVYCEYHRTAKMISYYYLTVEIHSASSTPFQLLLFLVLECDIFLEREYYCVENRDITLCVIKNESGSCGSILRILIFMGGSMKYCRTGRNGGGLFIGVVTGGAHVSWFVLQPLIYAIVEIEERPFYFI